MYTYYELSIGHIVLFMLWQKEYSCDHVNYGSVPQCPRGGHSQWGILVQEEVILGKHRKLQMWGHWEGTPNLRMGHFCGCLQEGKIISAAIEDQVVCGGWDGAVVGRASQREQLEERQGGETHTCVWRCGERNWGSGGWRLSLRVTVQLVRDT